MEDKLVVKRDGKRLKVSMSTDPFGGVEFEATVRSWLAWNESVLTLDLSVGDWNLFVRVPNVESQDGGPGEYELWGDLGLLRKAIRKSEAESKRERKAYLAGELAPLA